MQHRVLNELRYALRQLSLLNMRRELPANLRDYVERSRAALQSAESFLLQDQGFDDDLPEGKGETTIREGDPLPTPNTQERT
jgi:hypothetical protein